MFQKLKFSFWQILIGVDQLLNTLIGGWADETISSRAFRRSRDGSGRWEVARKIIDSVARALGQKNHCYEAWLEERLRKQLDPADRFMF